MLMPPKKCPVFCLILLLVACSSGCHGSKNTDKNTSCNRNKSKTNWNDNTKEDNGKSRKSERYNQSYQNSTIPENSEKKFEFDQEGENMLNKPLVEKSVEIKDENKNQEHSSVELTDIMKNKLVPSAFKNLERILQKQGTNQSLAQNSLFVALSRRKKLKDQPTRIDQQSENAQQRAYARACELKMSMRESGKEESVSENVYVQKSASYLPEESELDLEQPWLNTDAEFKYQKYHKEIPVETLERYTRESLHYYNIICTHMMIHFGEEGVETEGYERMLAVASIFSKNFKNFMKEDRWKILDNKILSAEDYQCIKAYCETVVDSKSEDVEKFKHYKAAVLRNILDYYYVVAKDHVVDACVQGFTGLILIRPKYDTWYELKYIERLKVWYQAWKTRFCYLPHRDEYLNHEKYVGIWIPNFYAFVLGYFAHFIQFFVPLTIIGYYMIVGKHKWEILNGEGLYHNFCPRDLNLFEYESKWENIYKLITKVTATILLFHLNGVLYDNDQLEWGKFKINYASLALNKYGLITSRIQKAISYFLVLITTVVLFFQNDDVTDIVLNYMAMQCIVQFDTELVDYHPIEKGIGTVNDGGRKIYLSYIASGCRDCENAKSYGDSRWFKYFEIFFAVFCLVLYSWVFICV